MSMAFEISSDDIVAVALRRDVKISYDRAKDLFNDLDMDAIEDEALQADNMDDQTELAFAEIDRQLSELGCWDEKIAHLDAQKLDEKTSKAPGTRSRRV